ANTMENTLDYWFNQMNTNRKEYKKVQVPKAPEKLLLSIIYGHLFTAIDQNDENNYDIEHLAPKGKMRILLNKFNNGEEENKLPISSFGNLCLLKEGINRKKKDKTLYEDTIYLNKLNDKHISLKEIEKKFTFTTKEDLDWINKDFNNFNDLKYEYTMFVTNRFQKQKRFILQNLFPDEDLTYISKEPITYITTGYVNQHATNTSLIKSSFVIHDKNNELGFYDILSKLKGWQKDIFLIINEIDKETFTLKDLYAYKDELQTLHPHNTTIEARIRSSLQELRDLGIIEFVSKGVYKRLWKV
ncbi:MAG: hypothetical protein LUH02_07265, partial [Erysipelotrichaceae bacterium]|nr:hypothetical protein [Erysipelotrichaceae bacterium]